MIAGGQVATGDRLPPEQHLCARIGVSRTVVREALSRLRADGLIVSRRGSGSYVQARPSQDLLRLVPIADLPDLLLWQDLRMTLESGSAALAAERRTRADLTALRQILDKLMAAMSSGAPGTEADYDFHRAIAAATHNRLFVAAIESLNRHIRNWIEAALSVAVLTPPERSRLVEQEHTAIYEGIASRDSEAASRAIRLHLANGRLRLLTGRRGM